MSHAATTSHSLLAVTPELMRQVTQIARDAGAEIMSVYDTNFAVDIKADHSPLTAADRAAHTLISDRLMSLFPDLPVLSEESTDGSHEFEQRRHWHQHWLVDPLDGTREFVKRNGEFTVNIALIHHHEPVLGVVFAPALELMYVGARALGAWRSQRGDELTRVHVQRPARARPVIVGSRSHRDASLDSMLERIGPHEMKSIGSSLKFCLVAEGTADFYPRFGPTSEWDTAAGQAVLTSAGGQVTDLAGQALRYNARSTLLNPSFVAFADPDRDWRGI